MTAAVARAGESVGLVSVRIGRQSFGVPVLIVQDVIAQTTVHQVPLAPRGVAGSLNLRGRIVTAIDMRERLGMAPAETGAIPISVVVEHHGELYALLVDDVGDVLWLTDAQRDAPPPTLSPTWRALCGELFRLDDSLLLVLDIEEVLALDRAGAPAALPGQKAAS